MPSNDRNVDSRLISTRTKRREPRVSPRALTLRPRPHRRAVIGELDEELDAELDLANMRAPPLKAIVH